MTTCPRCGAHDVRRSHYRPVERVVKYFTRRRPYRCLACRWRGWGLPEPLEQYAWHGGGKTPPAPDRGTEVDLHALDEQHVRRD